MSHACWRNGSRHDHAHDDAARGGPLGDLRRLDRAGSHKEKLRLLVEYCVEKEASHVPDPYYGGQRGFEEVEAGGPFRACLYHPLGDLVERPGLEREEVLAPGHAPLHQPGALQDADVLRHRVERDVERLGDLGDARLAGGEAPQDAAARVVGEGDQGVVELHRANIHPKG